MKKLLIIGIFLIVLTFQFCTSSKNTTASKQPAKITYTANIQPIIAANCTPCHFPPKGFKKAYDTYAPVKSDIDSIISRISRHPGERGFMPFKHPRLADSTIQVFVQWKADGLLQ